MRGQPSRLAKDGKVKGQGNKTEDSFLPKNNLEEAPEGEVSQSEIDSSHIERVAVGDSDNEVLVTFSSVQGMVVTARVGAMLKSGRQEESGRMMERGKVVTWTLEMVTISDEQSSRKQGHVGTCAQENYK